MPFVELDGRSFNADAICSFERVDATKTQLLLLTGESVTVELSYEFVKNYLAIKMKSELQPIAVPVPTPGSDWKPTP